MRNMKKGFTLIELLVVITIIGILSVIVIASIRKAYEKAKNTKTMLTFLTVEKALFATALEENLSRWPTESSLGLNNPTLDELKARTSGPLSSLENYLPNTPKNDFFIIKYQNNGSTTTFPCATPENVDNGVGLDVTITGSITADDYDKFYIADKMVDNGDGHLCGKIRAASDFSTFIYLISPDSTIN